MFGILAAANIAAALVLTFTDPDRRSDLWLMRSWCHDWLFAHRALYAAAGSQVDYPPWAIVTYAPLALIPPRAVVAVWLTINVACTGVMAWLTARLVAPSRPRRALVLPVLLFLCWGGTRTLLKLSEMIFALGLLAMTTTGSAIGAGVLLGLAFAKPPIAAPFLLWAGFARRWRTLAAAAAVVAIEVALYSAWSGEASLAALVHYRRIIGSIYGGQDAMVGLTGLRGLLDPILPAARLDVIVPAASAALLGVIVIVGLREGARARPESMPIGVALVCVWSLLTFHQQSYNVVLLFLPVMLIVCLREDRPIGRADLVVLALLQIVLMTDIAGRLPPSLAGTRPGRLLAQADRIAALVSLVWLSGLMRDRLRRRSGGGSWGSGTR